MIEVAVIIPVLGRPHRVEPLLASLHAARVAPSATVYPLFMCSPNDRPQLAAILRADPRPLHTVVPWEAGPADFSKKTNEAVRILDGEVYRDAPDFYFLGADDLEFTDGWLDEALAEHYRSGACVIGTNDDANPRTRAGHSSTHSLVYRCYPDECGTIDKTGHLLCELYQHNFVDDELVGTARHHDTYSHAPNAIVRHLHPNFDGDVERDETYKKGQSGFGEDRALFRRRQHLWGGR